MLLFIANRLTTGVSESQHQEAFEAKVHQASYCFESARPKACKRKGGWKFHDLSDEGEGFGKKKRAYGQHKLENEILQVLTDTVAYMVLKHS